VTVQFVVDPSNNKAVSSIYDGMLSDEDEACFSGCSRFVIYSLTVLPFSTGFMATKYSIFHFAHSAFLNLFFAIPTLVGWVTLLVCCPTFFLENTFD